MKTRSIGTLAGACSDYDQNPNWWNSLWCTVALDLPGNIRADYQTNPNAFPVAQTAPAAPTADQLATWTPQQALDQTNASLGTNLQRSIDNLPDTNPPAPPDPSGLNWWLIALFAIGGFVLLDTFVLAKGLNR
jgi:hypothetical protein